MRILLAFAMLCWAAIAADSPEQQAADVRAVEILLEQDPRLAGVMIRHLSDQGNPEWKRLFDAYSAIYPNASLKLPDHIEKRVALPHNPRMDARAQQRIAAGQEEKRRRDVAGYIANGVADGRRRAAELAYYAKKDEEERQKRERERAGEEAREKARQEAYAAQQQKAAEERRRRELAEAAERERAAGAQNEHDIAPVDADYMFVMEHVIPRTVPFKRQVKAIGELLDKAVNGGGDSFAVIDGYLEVEITGDAFSLSNKITKTKVHFSGLRKSAVIFNDFPFASDGELSLEEYGDWQTRKRWEDDIEIRLHVALRDFLLARKMDLASASDNFDDALARLTGSLETIAKPNPHNYHLIVKLSTGTRVTCVVKNEETDGLFWIRLGDRIELAGHYSEEGKTLSDAAVLSVGGVDIYLLRAEWTMRAQEIIGLARTIRNKIAPRHGLGIAVVPKEDGLGNTAWIDVARMRYYELDKRTLAFAVGTYFMDLNGGGIPIATLRDSESDKVIFEMAGINNTMGF